MSESAEIEGKYPRMSERDGIVGKMVYSVFGVIVVPSLLHKLQNTAEPFTSSDDDEEET